MNFLNKGTAVAILAMVMGTTAFAETTPTNATTTATAEAVAPKLSDKVSLSWLGQINGPSVAQVGTLDRLSQTPGGELSIANLLTGYYKFTPELMAGVGIAGTHVPVHGHRFTFADPYLQVTKSKLISIDTFSVKGNFRVYVPATAKSRTNHVMTSFGSYDVINYDVPNTKWSIGSYLFLKYNVFAANTGEAAVYKIMVNPSPFVNYQVSDPIGVWVNYDVAYTNAKGAAHNEWAADPSLLIGGSFDFDSARYNVSPYLVLPMAGGVTSKSTTIGAYLSAKIL